MDTHLRDLRYFVAVAEELNFTRAATERLFISQPALSKQIRQLEAALRVKLFDRDRRAVTLTSAGAALLPHARQLLAQWEQARRAVAETARERALTVGFHTRIGRGLIPDVTERMTRLAPEWRLRFRQISWRDPTAGLVDGEADVAIAWLPVPDSGRLAWRVVATEARWVALPADHPLAGRPVVGLADLADQPFIALPAAAGPARRFWLAADERATPPTVVAEAQTAEETFEAVASGLGVALLAEGNTEIYRRPDVVYRPVPDISPAELAVIWRADDDRHPVRVFAETCFRCLCAPTGP